MCVVIGAAAMLLFFWGMYRAGVRGARTDLRRQGLWVEELPSARLLGPR
jgi:hypothetical protein